MTTAVDLFVFGNKTGPRSPRFDVDFYLENEKGLVAPGELPLPHGASAFADPLANEKPEGHYHRLPSGTPLPAGLAVVRDDAIAVEGSKNPLTHHTIYPTVELAFADFCAKFLSLPWQYAGNKKRR